MKRRDLIIGLIVLVVAISAGFLWFSDSGLRMAPAAELTLIDGRDVKISDYRGKTVIVNFWATTCVGCRREVPHLVQLRKHYGTDVLEVLGVAMSYDPETQVKEFARAFAIDYPVGVDQQDQIADAFGEVRLVPTTFVVSPEGRIIWQKLGEFTSDEIDAVLARHIQPRA